MSMQWDLASKSKEGDSWLSLLPVYQLSDWKGFKSNEEPEITLGELW